MSNLITAQEILAEIRSNTHSHNDSMLKTLKGLKKRLGVTWKKLGTKKAEIKKLRCAGYKNEALKYWRFAAKCASNSDDYLAKMKLYLKKARTKPKDIGLSKKQIRAVRLTSYCAEAALWLEEANKNIRPEDKKSRACFAVRFLVKAKAQPSIIGTSVQKLRNLGVPSEMLIEIRK